MFKNIFYVIAFGTFIINVQAASTLDLNYSIQFNEKMECLDITSILPTGANNELIINIPQRGVSSLNIQPNYIQSNDLSPFIKKISFATPTQVTIQYQLCMNNPTHHIDLPIIEKHFLQLMVLNSLVLPLQREREESQIKINLNNAPKNFTFVSSKGLVKSNTITFNGQLNEFVSYVLAGSDHNLQFQIDKKPFIALSSNRQNPFPTIRLEKLKKVSEFQQSLMEDKDNSPLLLTFVNVPEFSSSFARHFSNTVSVSIPEKKKEDSIVSTFSHEMFHHWLGWKLRADKYHGELLWFMEGIDDYFGLSSAYQSGAISKQSYTNNINNLLKDYYLSPIHHLSYDKLVEKYKDDLQHNVIAQIRGHLAAIVLQGDSKKPLKNENLTIILKDLLKIKCPDEYCVLTPELLEQQLNEKLTAKEVLQLKQFISSGKDLNLPTKLNGNELKLTNMNVLYPKFGFDLDTFFSSHIIKDLNSDSPEYKAGLRDGMEVLQYNLYLHDPHRKVTITVKSNAEFKHVEFFPQTQYAVIPQYV
ncbi:MAG: hypothetical protein HYX61_04260 [Gammaproteobacteria bacterium]|jgi:hypothetical protein|nr:hypothetical protein [Gammaproteobacteria bacterium]